MLKKRRPSVVKVFRTAENARRRLLLTGPIGGEQQTERITAPVVRTAHRQSDSRSLPSPRQPDRPGVGLMAALATADVVVVGVACTGKAAVCEYLLRHGLRACRFVVHPQQSLPAALVNRRHGLIAALSMRPDRLSDARRQRLIGLGRDSASIDGDAVRQEVLEARRIYATQGWPVIDVSHQSPSAVAARIVALFERRQAQT